MKMHLYTFSILCISEELDVNQNYVQKIKSLTSFNYIMSILLAAMIQVLFEIFYFKNI